MITEPVETKQETVVIEQTVKSKKVRSPDQLKALEAAREKALEVRKASADVTKKVKELKQYERDQKKIEVLRKYDEMVAKKNTPAQLSTPRSKSKLSTQTESETVKAEDEEEVEEEILVHETPVLIHKPTEKTKSKAKKKPKPPPPSEASSDEEPTTPPKKQQPPAYKQAFEHGMWY